MKNFIEVLQLEQVLKGTGICYKGVNFELVYDELASSPNFEEPRRQIEKAIKDYFTALALPDCVTLYDQLLLSLRPKDIIATFNWDPFLLQACARNRLMGNLPQVVFLHGNVYLGYCPEDPNWGYSTQNCSKCGKPFQASPLLFPIKDKNYTSHPLLVHQWKELSRLLESAYMLTIFGYAAPSSAAAAREMMLKAWNANSTRELAQIEIIDILPQRVINARWSDFTRDLHGGKVSRFSHTWQFKYPRRSCEALAFATLQMDPWATREMPRFRRLDQLQRWVAPLIEEEIELEKNNVPLRSFRNTT